MKYRTIKIIGAAVIAALYAYHAANPRGPDHVIDGDTFVKGGVTIRVADIDAPETHPPHCPYEARLGQRATDRLRELLNLGPYTMEPSPGEPDRDRYGRQLRILRRDGLSLGGIMVREGLARAWHGSRRPWCN